MIEQRLCAPDRKGRDDDGAAALDGALDDLAERFGGIGRIVEAVSVGRFNDDVICFGDSCRVRKDWVAVAAKVP